MADFVGAGLAGVGNVAVEFGLGPSGRGFPEFEVGQCLFAGPPFGVKAGIDHQTRGAEEIETQVALQRLKSADSAVDITQDYRHKDFLSVRRFLHVDPANVARLWGTEPNSGHCTVRS